MLLKLYAIFWMLFSLSLAAFFLTGNLSPLAVVVFGFISCTLIFMGIISVLPGTVAHPAPAKPRKPAKVTAPVEAKPAADGFGIWKSA